VLRAKTEALRGNTVARGTLELFDDAPSRESFCSATVSALDLARPRNITVSKDEATVEAPDPVLLWGFGGKADSILELCGISELEMALSASVEEDRIFDCFSASFILCL